MTPPKSAAELAEAFAQESFAIATATSATKRDCMREGYLAGHAAGIAQAGELAEACKRLISVGSFGQEYVAMADALDKYLKALAGDV